MAIRRGNLIRIVIVLLALLAGNTANAQERFGGVAGVVTDASQAPVPGVDHHHHQQADRRGTRVVVSGADGAYRVPDLEPGRYTVTVELQGFQKIAGRRRAGAARTTIEFPATLKVGGVNEVVTVTADAEKQIDLRSTTDRAQRHGGRVRPHAQGAQLPGHRADLARREPGRRRRRIPGERRERRREQLHRRRREHEQPAVRQLAPGHGVRVPAGSAGQDRRHRRGVRRRARRRDQRGDQVGRQQVHRRGPLLLLGQRACRRSPVPRLQLSPLDDTTVFDLQDEKQDQQPQRGWRIDRRTDRQGSPVLLRLGVAAVRARGPTTTCSRTAPSLERFRRSRPRPRRSAR